MMLFRETRHIRSIEIFHEEITLKMLNLGYLEIGNSIFVVRCGSFVCRV